MSEFITTEEAAGLSGYHPVYIRRLIREGKIEAQKRGRDWWIVRDSLVNYMTEMNELGDKRGPKAGPDPD